MVRGDGVGRRYKAGGYADAAAFAADCRLVFANAMTFNKETDEPVHVAAKWLATKFEERYGDAIADALDLDSSDDEAE